MPQPTDHLDPADLPGRRPPRVVPRTGTVVLFHHNPDGTVTAVSRLASGTGRTAAEAIADLDRRLRAAPPG